MGWPSHNPLFLVGFKIEQSPFAQWSKARCCEKVHFESSPCQEHQSRLKSSCYLVKSHCPRCPLWQIFPRAQTRRYSSKTRSKVVLFCAFLRFFSTFLRIFAHFCSFLRIFSPLPAYLIEIFAVFPYPFYLIVTTQPPHLHF